MSKNQLKLQKAKAAEKKAAKTAANAERRLPEARPSSVVTTRS